MTRTIPARATGLVAALLLPLAALPVVLAGPAAAATTPRIDHVSTVIAQSPGTYDSGPTVVIDGEGFGSEPPRVTEAPVLDDTQLGQSALGVQANTRNLHIVDDGFWATDHMGLYPSDDNNCYLTIGKWTDTQVIVMLDDAGITAACSAIGSGDDLAVEIWSTDDGGGYGISPGSGLRDIGEAQDVGHLATVDRVSAASGPVTGGTFAPDGTADPDGIVTVSGSGLQDASVLWFGDGGYSGAVAVARCGSDQDPAGDDCFSESDGRLHVRPPAASAGEDKGVFLGVATPGGTSHLDCATVFTCHAGVFYYQSPSTVFSAFDQDIDLEYPDHSIGFTGGKEVDEASCPGSAPSGPTGITYSVTATASAGKVNLTGRPLTSVNAAVSSLQVPMVLSIDEPVQLDFTVSGQISGCVAIPLLGGEVGPLGGGLYMMVGGSLDGSYTFHVLLNQGQIVLNAGYVPGGIMGAGIVSESCTDTDGDPVPCLQTSDEWTAGGSVFFSPLWLDVKLDAEPFEFSAGAGLTLAGRVQAGTGAGSTGHEICYGGTYQVAASADLGATSFEYNRAGAFYGPFHLAGNSPELCPLGAIESDGIATTTTVAADDPVHTHEGIAVTYRASVDPTDASGTVTFSQDGQPLEDCTDAPVTDGTAVCTVLYDGSGSHQIGAAYSGDGDHEGSQAAPLTQTVTRAEQVIDFTLPEHATVGDAVPLTAVGGDSGQDVTYTVPVSHAGVCRISHDDLGAPQLSLTGVGTCRVIARQPAAGGFRAADNVVRTLEVGKAAQAISFTPPTGAVTGGRTTLDATATSTAPAYSVQGTSSEVCGIESDAGTGEPTLVYLAAGRCDLVIEAPADDLHEAVTSTVTVDVSRAPTSTAVSITPESVVARVAPSTSHADPASLDVAVPDADVDFTVDGQPVGSAPVVDGVAELALPLAAGHDHAVVATYGDDDPNYLGSTDSAVRADPLITARVTSDHARVRGWYRSPVTVTYTCTPTSAPLAEPCPAAVRLRRNGAVSPLHREVAGVDGGRAESVVRGIRIDRRGPRVTYVVRSHPRPGLRPVRVEVSDPLSGVASKRTTTRTVVQLMTGRTVVRYRTVAFDRAGNRTVQVFVYVPPRG